MISRLCLLVLLGVCAFALAQQAFQLGHHKIERSPKQVHAALKRKYASLLTRSNLQAKQKSNPRPRGMPRATSIIPLSGDINTIGEFFLPVEIGNPVPFSQPQVFQLQVDTGRYVEMSGDEMELVLCEA
jgi:hypothetical protein